MYIYSIFFIGSKIDESITVANIKYLEVKNILESCKYLFLVSIPLKCIPGLCWNLFARSLVTLKIVVRSILELIQCYGNSVKNYIRCHGMPLNPFI